MRYLTKLVLPAALLAVVAMSSATFAIHPPKKPDAAATPAAVETVAAADDALADPALAGADLDKGKRFFQSKGCIGCHGWNGDGLGKNPRSNSFAALLRETTLDPAGLVEVIECGRPGTGMPYHDTAAYRDDRCYGMVMDDFEAGLGPIKGNTMTMKDIVNVAAYIATHIQGKGKTTLAECQEFFGASADKACRGLE